MTKLLSHSIIASMIIFSSCDKSNDTISSNNCGSLITDTLGTNDNATIYMPNAFSPNADGLNDMIKPICRNVSSIEFIIVDQNKNVVFSTNLLDRGWGTTSGSNSSTKYYYTIQAITSANHKIGICGDLYKLSCRPNNTTIYFEDQLTQTGFTNPTAEVLPRCR